MNLHYYEYFLTIFNYLGTFVFAISGAAAGLHRHTDIFGTAVLAVVAACFGGIMRDVLIGALPPDNIQAWQPLAISLVATVATLRLFPLLAEKLNHPVQFFDAIGLGLFTVLGADKALTYGITAPWAVLLGVITGVGGGIVRDILLARVPLVLRKEIYATAALAGATILVAAKKLELIPDTYALIAGAMVCITLRLLALFFNWQVPILPRRH